MDSPSDDKTLLIATSLLKISPRYAKMQLRELRKKRKYEEKAEAALRAATRSGYTESPAQFSESILSATKLTPLDLKRELYESLLEIRPSLVSDAVLAVETAKALKSAKNAAYLFLKNGTKIKATAEELKSAQLAAKEYILHLGRFSPDGISKPKRLTKNEVILKKELLKVEDIGISFNFLPSSKKLSSVKEELKSAMDKALDSITCRDEFKSLSPAEQEAVKSAASSILSSLNKRELHT
jgi:hypothetical protein